VSRERLISKGQGQGHKLGSKVKHRPDCDVWAITPACMDRF